MMDNKALNELNDTLMEFGTVVKVEGETFTVIDGVDVPTAHLGAGNRLAVSDEAWSGFMFDMRSWKYAIYASDVRLDEYNMMDVTSEDGLYVAVDVYSDAGDVGGTPIGWTLLTKEV